MKLTVSAVSDIGKIRRSNEDMILIKDELLRDGAKTLAIEYNVPYSPFLVAVADGMGGHRAGGLASEIVAFEMGRAVSTTPPGLQTADLKNALRERILSIHGRLNTEGAAPEKRMMGFTFAGLLFYEQAVYLINIGDSRIYRLRNGILSRLTRDHSLAVMTNNPAAPANILVNTFGAGADIFFDFEDITKRIIAGDLFLICSDGLTNELADDDIESILTHSAGADGLVCAALDKGGNDNVSAVVVKEILISYGLVNPPG